MMKKLARPYLKVNLGSEFSPDWIKEEIRTIAEQERRSMSFVAGYLIAAALMARGKGGGCSGESGSVN